MLLSSHNWTCLHIFYISIYIYTHTHIHFVASCSLLAFDRKQDCCFRMSLCTLTSWYPLNLLKCCMIKPPLIEVPWWKNCSVLTAQRRRNLTVYLSATVILHLDFPPPPPLLHCYLKREVILIIRHLPQPDLSKRKHVFIFNSLLVSGYYGICGTSDLSLIFSSCNYLQREEEGRGARALTWMSCIWLVCTRSLT